MPARSYQILLSNNAEVPLTLQASRLCHGKWTDGGWNPPQQIPARSLGQWQSESDGVFTGTEGWVKYELQPTGVNSNGYPLPPEQVYLHWDNPYIPTSPDIPNGTVSLSDVVPDCGGSNSDQEGGSTFSGASPDYEVFLSGGGVGSVDWLNQHFVNILLAFFPLVSITEFFKGNSDGEWCIFTLRQKGSVTQSLPLNYDRS